MAKEKTCLVDVPAVAYMRPDDDISENARFYDAEFIRYQLSIGETWPITARLVPLYLKGQING